MNRIYCCRCKTQSLGDESFSAFLLDDSYETFDEAVIENFTLCEFCKNEFVNVFMHKTIEEPHKIVDERVLLSEAAREDVKEYMVECGLDEDLAFLVSECVRKGQVHVRGWREDMMKAMKKASVPEWFFEACKNIKYMSNRNNYRPPYLADELFYQEFFPIEDTPKSREKVNLQGVTILSEANLEKNKDLIRIRKPFWLRVNVSSDEKGKCGVVMGPGANESTRAYQRKWGAIYPVILLKDSKIESGTKLIYAGEEFIVLQEGIALCKSSFMYMKEAMITATCFDETPMKQMLNQWFEYYGDVAEVAIE